MEFKIGCDAVNGSFNELIVCLQTSPSGISTTTSNLTENPTPAPNPTGTASNDQISDVNTPDEYRLVKILLNCYIVTKVL